MILSIKVLFEEIFEVFTQGSIAVILSIMVLFEEILEVFTQGSRVYGDTKENLMCDRPDLLGTH